MSYCTDTLHIAPSKTPSEADIAHARVLGLGRSYQHALAQLAVELRRVEVHDWHHLHGCSTVAEYTTQTCGLPQRRTRELLRAARELEQLPVLAAAFEDGELVWSKIREVTRVAIADTGSRWLEYAQEQSCRQVAIAVAMSSRGDEPPEPGNPPGPARRVRITFEVLATTAERLRSALTAIGVILDGERTDGERADDDARLDAMARMVCARLASEEATPSTEAFQVVVAECPSCETMTHLLRALLRPVLRNELAAPAARGHGHSEEQVLSSAQQAQIRCDSVIIAPDGVRRRAVPARARRQVLARQRGVCAVPGCDSRLWLDIHHLLPFAQGGTHQPANLCAICTGHHAAVHEGGLQIERHHGVLRFEWRLLPERGSRGTG